jgi:hypothetical protein
VIRKLYLEKVKKIFCWSFLYNFNQMQKLNPFGFGHVGPAMLVLVGFGERPVKPVIFSRAHFSVYMST